MSPNRFQPPAAVPVPDVGELMVDDAPPPAPVPGLEVPSAVLAPLPFAIPLASEVVPLSVPESGTLAELPLARLLYGLYVDGFSGALSLTHDGATRRIHFSRGGIAMVNSTQLADHIGRFLLERGELNPAQYTQLRDQWSTAGDPEALLWSSVAATSRDAAEQAYIERLVCQAFAWHNATFTVQAGLPASPARTHPLPLVCRGVCDHYHRAPIVSYFEPHAAMYIRPSTRFAVHWRSVGPLLKNTGVVAFLDGKANFKTALETQQGTVPQALYALWSMDMITVSQEPAAR